MSPNTRSAEFYTTASWPVDQFPALDPKSFPDAQSFSKLRRSEEEQKNEAKDGDGVHIFWETSRARDGAMLNLLCYEKQEQQLIDRGQRPLVVAFHGGGWVIGDYAVEDRLCREAVRQFDCLAVSVHYRLSPEHTHPIPLQDCSDTLENLIEASQCLKFDKSKILLVASSAGASLACGAYQAIHQQLRGNVRGLVLNIPVTCDPLHFPSKEYSNRSWTEHAKAPLLNAEAMSFCFDLYSPGRTKDPLISTLLSPILDRFPPTGIICAGFDPMCDQGIALSHALAKNGVPTRLRVFEGLPHGFHMIEGLPAAEEATNEMIAQIRWMLDLKAGNHL